MPHRTPRPASTSREEALGVVDRVRVLCDTIENEYDSAHEYAYGPRDGRTDEQTHKPKSGPADRTGSIVVEQTQARAILRRTAGRIVAWEQAGLRVLEKLSEMTENPDEWEPLEGSRAFGPINQDTTTQAWKEGDAQRNKRRIQNELQRIELRRAKLQRELRDMVKGA